MRYSGWVPATDGIMVIVWPAVAGWGRRWAGLALRVRAGLGGHEHAPYGGPSQGPINFVFHPCRIKIVKLAVTHTKNRLHLKQWNWAEKDWNLTLSLKRLSSLFCMCAVDCLWGKEDVRSMCLPQIRKKRCYFWQSWSSNDLRGGKTHIWV